MKSSTLNCSGRKDNVSEAKSGEIIDFKELKKEEILEYLKDKMLNKDIDLNNLLKEINYQNYGFRYVNKVINKYNLKINI